MGKGSLTRPASVSKEQYGDNYDRIFNKQKPAPARRFMPPTKRTIHVPEGGWLPHAIYVCEVAMFPGNPVHEALFYTGFIDGGEPSSYSGIMEVPGEDTEYYGLKNLHYCKPIHLVSREIECEFQLCTEPNMPAIDDSNLPGMLDDC